MNHNFNAIHAPIGAHASFTLGCPGREGGLGLELGGPAGDNIYIGVTGEKPDQVKALPFFEENKGEHLRYAEGDCTHDSLELKSWRLSEVQRFFDLGVDSWSVEGLSFSIYAPVESVPDPKTATGVDLKRVLRPSVLAELSFDNSKGRTPRRLFFGYAPKGGNDAMRRIEGPNNLKGVGQGHSTAVFTDHKKALTATAFTLKDILQEKDAFNYGFALGDTGLIMVDVPAEKKVKVPLAICFFRGGDVTTGVATRYLYTRWFKDIESVGAYSLKEFASIRKAARASKQLIKSKTLNSAQRFQLIHSIHSYYGSTQLLESKGDPLWVVNEGEYRMLNTFDLTVDQLFYEMKLNPWAVKNVLDQFVDRYSYTDRVHAPGEENIHPGGISFTHDMGQRNHFSPKGRSSYEMMGLSGCFSHMTHEQLVNWVLCASVYAVQTQDHAWLKKRYPIFKKCFTSLLHRDASVDAKRNGLMSLDSSRTGLGAEITTYDSLDESLGQARCNGYMAVKTWAAYVALDRIFSEQGGTRQAGMARKQAERAAKTIVSYATEGELPALLGEPSESRIIPMVEGLVFPWAMGIHDALSEEGPYGDLIQALQQHTRKILKKGVCIYPDGGWKLSSSADNSWLSKIYLCQFIVREILEIRTPSTGIKADQAHMKWLLKKENLRWAWSDQMHSGVAKGSLYYPRGVTSILWLQETTQL